MALPEQYRRDFSKFVSDGEVPHLLLFGPPGSGKTTISIILMDAIPCSRLVLNASSGDRGIGTMKEKVKQFAASQTLRGKIKIVFLDEADGLTKDAQEALRNTIETYSRSCRFILTCNEVGAISEALRSRCMMYEFTAFPQHQVVKKAGEILESENISYNTDDISKIVSQYYPDIRSVINNLQLCSMGGQLDPEAVSRVSVDLDILLQLISTGDLRALRQMLVGVTSFTALYKVLFDTVVEDDSSSQEIKISIISLLSEHLYRDAVVANREINFVSCCVSLMSILGVPDIIF